MISLLLACQWCKDLMSWGLAQGFAWTIGLLLAVPFLLVAVITWRLSRAARRQVNENKNLLGPLTPDQK